MVSGTNYKQWYRLNVLSSLKITKMFIYKNNYFLLTKNKYILNKLF